MNSSVSHAFQYALSFGLSALISLAGLLYLMYRLPPDEFALIGITQGLILVTELLIGVEAYSLVPINLLQKKKFEFYKFLNTYNKLAVTNFIFIFGLCIFFGLIYSEYKWPLWYAGSYCLLRYFMKNITSILVQEKKSKQFAVFYFFNTALANLIAISWLESISTSWHARIIGLILSDFVFILIFRKMIIIEPRNTKSSDSTRPIFVFGAPLIPAALAFWSINQIDRYIAAHFFSLEIVGIYVAAYNLGKTIDIPVRVFNTVLRPKLFESLKKSRDLNTYRNVLAIFVTFLVPSSFILFFIIYFAAPHFLTKEYVLSLNLMPITLAFYCSLGFWRLAISTLEFHKRTTITATIAIFCSVINIVLSLLLIKVFGYYAPIFASCFSLVLACILAVLFTYKYMNFIDEKQ